ncbi:MAG: hypothetical protein FWF81_01940 [Defluviitaleaceae bacterium]|nr:hypothetical protein [Defluviitaleaceae bacterium]
MLLIDVPEAEYIVFEHGPFDYEQENSSVGDRVTREAFVKIERGIQHIQASQLRGIRDILHTTYDELLKPDYVDNQLTTHLESIAEGD